VKLESSFFLQKENKERKSKANKSHKKEIIKRYRSDIQSISNSQSMKTFSMFIWICCMLFFRGHGLNISAKFHGNHDNGGKHR
jgi:hypothetical protein